MTEAEVIQEMREHLEGLFPKFCPKCNRRFGSLREYLKETRMLGPAIPYDALMDDWEPQKPLGTMSYANCDCGTTMVLTSEGMPLLKLWSLLRWARAETKKRGMSPQELLNYLRERICEQVLEGPDRPGQGGEGAGAS